MPRLNKEREERLEPKRMKKALEELEKKDVEIIKHDRKSIIFNYKRNVHVYYPYSGWATGSNIKDGRGLKNLLKQLNEKRGD